VAPQIRSVRCRELTARLHTPFVTALRRTDVLRSLLVEVTDGDGVTGVGEAAQVWQVTGESIASIRACIEGPLAEHVVGTDPGDLVETLRRMSSAVHGNSTAKAAVDTALHDLAARRLGIPLVQLLGGTSLRVATDVTVSATAADLLAATASARVADGFTVLKLKVGTDPDGDVARVLAVRAAVGPAATLRLDANQGWTPRTAVRVISCLEDGGADVELVEQPVAAANLDGLRWVTDHVATPILADESVFGVRDLIAVLQRRAADMVNVKLAKAGGLRPARTLLELAAAHGVGTLVGTMMEGPVGVGAAASLAAAHRTDATDDLDAAWWLASPPFPGGATYRGAEVHLPDRPGLGVELPASLPQTLPAEPR
jgi:L-alanine-DL-glutamate epimerase-like enolase superfamily enzyme